jgi:Protein of unknown function (DUF3617)
MPGRLRISVLVAALGGLVALAATAAPGDGIAPGLWRIVSRTETGGVIGPPHESSRCLTADEAQDVAATFVPPSPAASSSCGPAEHSLNGKKLIWRLTCKGQTDMEQTGEFNFDSPHHYTATMRTRAAVSGQTMIDSQDTLEGQWVSECR